MYLHIKKRIYPLTRLERLTSVKAVVLTGVLFVFSFLCSCIDPIEFEVPTGLSDSIVLQGRVVLADPSFVEVNVSRLFDFSPESRQPVSVKNVVLYDNNGNQMLLDTRVPGSYLVELDESSPIQAEIGTSYSISFETFDNRKYESTFEVLLENKDPAALNLSLTQSILPNALGVFTPTRQIKLAINTSVDNSSNGGIYWEVRNIYALTDTPEEGEPKTCYINKPVNVNEIYVLDPSELTSSKIDQYELLTSLIDWRFAEGIYYEVKQYSVSGGAYAYWDAVNTLSERQGNMFDGPVGQISTNIVNVENPEDRIFGYFFASHEKTIRVKVDPDLVGPIPLFCPRPGITMGVTSCDDCLIEPQATIVKPDYWID